MNQRGFTIVELVVTIAVAAIIVTLGFLASAEVQKDARDKKREADIVLFQNELEKYYEKNGEYPPGCTNSCTSWFFTENVSSGGVILQESSTLANVQSILPDTPDRFGDPHAKSSTIFSSYGSLKERYVYFGGAVNNRTYASSVTNSTPPPNRCNFIQNLSPGQVGSYIAAYYSEVDSKWVLKLGQHGVKPTLQATSHASCVLN